MIIKPLKRERFFHESDSRGTIIAPTELAPQELQTNYCTDNKRNQNIKTKPKLKVNLQNQQ